MHGCILILFSYNQSIILNTQGFFPLALLNLLRAHMHSPVCMHRRQHSFEARIACVMHAM